VARALPWLVTPVCIWRLPIAFGFEMGALDGPWVWWQIPYVFALSLLSELGVLLTVGLVSSWGEVFPAWLPFVGGKRVPVAAAVVPATLAGLGGLYLVYDWVVAMFGSEPTPYAPGWNALAHTVSGLFVLWGPLLLALTYAYWQRRRGE
jgi:glycerol-3-phosphate acyltransferase PlsY